ncbi:Choline O-acetyltransferase [Lamellibrachia satsuma]|nr:Choline O-acetyltransferase [Lamellibrachia satsuma]
MLSKSSRRPLPKLPIPNLSDTLNKYLRCIQPIVTAAQYETTRHLVAEFGRPGGEGEYLQEKLQQHADTVDNWVSQFWLDDMYLKVQLPLPVNSNPGMVFPRQAFPDQDAQLRFAARLISGVLDYKVIIDSRSLPIDRARHRAKGQPLCMEQYYRLFTTYRVPGVTKDVLVRPDESIMPEPEHVIVICKNQFFVLDVVVNFTRLTVDDLFTQLTRIVRKAQEGESEAERVGILTAGRRDDWARARMRLMQDSTNRDCLDMIERCIFVLCLDKRVCHDDAASGDTQWRDDVSLALQMEHGAGTAHNTCNRWFDKTMQVSNRGATFIIGEDGACGLCYEHSPSEGIAVVQLIEHLLKYMEEVRKCQLPRWQSICELSRPRKLKWQIADETRADIARAMSNTDKWVVLFF